MRVTHHKAVHSSRVNPSPHKQRPFSSHTYGHESLHGGDAAKFTPDDEPWNFVRSMLDYFFCLSAPTVGSLSSHPPCSSATLDLFSVIFLYTLDEPRFALQRFSITSHKTRCTAHGRYYLSSQPLAWLHHHLLHKTSVMEHPQAHGSSLPPQQHPQTRLVPPHPRQAPTVGS